MYKKVELKNGFVGMENEVADYWKKNDIIKKNFDMNKGKRYFTFYVFFYSIGSFFSFFRMKIKFLSEETE